MKRVGTILIGIVFVVVGIVLMMNESNLKKRCTVETIGTIVRIDKEQRIVEDEDSIRKEYTYYPVIEYEAGSLTFTEKVSSGTSNASKYYIDEKVEILYNPEKADEFILKGNNNAIFPYIIFVALGVLAVALGCFGKIQ